MSKYELSLSTGYVPTWGIVEAVREFMQNAKDQEATVPDNEMFWDYDPIAAQLRIGNKNSVLSASTLLLGSTTKATDSNTIGQFGEGYKIATLVALRNEVGVTFYNYGAKEVWRPRIVKSRKYGADVLTFFTESYGWSSPPSHNLIIELDNITPEMFEKIKESNLDMMDETAETAESITTYKTSIGSVLLDEDLAGKIFVNGLLVTKVNYFKYGYDFIPSVLRLDRDRHAVDSFDVSWETSRMWREIGATEECLELVGSSEYTDCKYLASGTVQPEVSMAITKSFIEEYGSKAIPVTCQADVALVNLMYKDAEAIIVTDAQKAIINSSSLFKPDAEEVEEKLTLKEQIEAWANEWSSSIADAAFIELQGILEAADEE